MACEPKKHCRNCRLFLDQHGVVCEASTGLDMLACKKFKAGPVFSPHFNDKPIKEIKFDSTTPGAWAFWIDETHALLLVWDVDHNQYGHFRTFLLGVDDNGVIKKKYTPHTALPAFFGELAVKGPNSNDIWSSYGYEDADEVDGEGNIINKPREVKLYPQRDD